MSNFEFKLPDIGEGVAEGEVVAWHVEPGQLVKEDQEMVEVMTDKATVTIGCPKAGRISQLNAEVGETVAVGAVLVVIDTQPRASEPVAEPKPHAENDTALGKFQAPAALPPAARKQAMQAMEDAAREAGGRKEESEEGPAATAVGDIRDSLPGSDFFASAGGNGASHASANGGTQVHQGTTADYFMAKPLATPATRKLARDMGVDLRRVPPSGPNGRVTKADVRGFGMEETPAPAQEMQVRAPQAPAAPAMPTMPVTDVEHRTPFVGLRRKIAERMQSTKNTAAHFTFVEEVDVTRLKQTLERLKPLAAEQGVRLHYLPFIVKAVTLALRKHPSLNSMLDEATNELVEKRYYHIGVAAATDQGLVVPVVRHADRLSPLQIAAEVQRLGDGARAGTLKPQELSGSTFSITSLGKQGGMLATPILNHPEVGILGVHRIKQKPVVRDGEIVVGDVMNLSLSFDHRIIDGHIGAAFAYEVIGYLEEPDRLMLELS